MKRCGLKEEIMDKKHINIGVKLDQKQLARLDAEIAIWGLFVQNARRWGRR